MSINNVVQFDETDSGNVDISGIGLSDSTLIDQLDNIARAQMGAIARFTGADTVVATTTTDLGTLAGQYVEITGTTTITGLGTIRAGIIKFVRFAGALTLTYNATSLILPGAANIVTVAGDTAVLVSLGSGNWRCIAYQRSDGTPLVAPTVTPPKGHLFGLTLSNNTTDATNDIDIAAGDCASDGATTAMMTLATGLTKRLDAVWAVGTNAGMLASGAAIADTTYHIFLIKRPDTGVVDVAADTSVTGANIAANTNAAYTQIRRIGSIVRTSAAIKAFYQYGDEFVWHVPVQNFNNDNPGTSALTITTTVPTGIVVLANITGETGNGGTNHYILFSPLAVADTLPSSLNSQLGVAGNVRFNVGRLATLTNTSGQIRMRTNASAAGDVFVVNTVGYTDYRGRI